LSNVQRIGPYELQELLIDDTLEEVWKALDTHRRRYVGVSILHVNPQVSTNAIAHFHEKIENLIHLHHPNIAQILDIRTVQAVDKANRGILIACDYIEGQSLAHYIQASSRGEHSPSLDTIVRLLAPVGAAIDYVHQHGITHGAVRPGNILLDKHNTLPDAPGVPRLTGFCTHYLQPSLAVPLDDAFYISPEQAQGYMDNPASDIYALSVIFYELCTGSLPFQGQTPGEVLNQHIHNSPSSPALLNPNLPSAFTSAILRGLSKDPRARFSTVSAMVQELASAVDIPAHELLDISGVWSDPRTNSQSGLLNNPSQPSGPLPRQSAPLPTLSAQSAPLPTVPDAAYNPASLYPAVSLLTPSTSPAGPVAPSVNTNSQPYAAVSRPPLPSGPQYAVQPTVSAPYPAVKPPQPRKGTPWLYIVATGVLIFALLASAIFLYPLIRNSSHAPAANTLAGQAFFTNSGQYTPDNDQGIADIVQVHMSNIPDPPAGKNYYFWILPDADNSSSSGLPILLGSSSNGGNIDIPFGDPNNQDLLSTYSRFLLTEESSATPPVSPSLDKSTWRYYAAFSQTKDPLTGLSVLDHLRHLLSQDPKLKSVGLNGGLDIWLYRDALNVMVLSSSIRDNQSAGTSATFLRRQIVRILDYLDGSQYISQVEKLPPGVPPVLINPTVAKVALLEFDERNQFPPGYLAHIGTHLASISQSPNVTPEQKALAIQINQSLNNVQFWLSQVHKDAQKLMQMSDAQLLQPGARPLFNDLYLQANHAFTGQFDPNTNRVQEGVTQIHADILRLATFDIQPYQANA
jgi:eukaryotic-like serine/threonine-protein kinase